MHPTALFACPVMRILPMKAEAEPLSYAHSDAPIGPGYEAALPERNRRGFIGDIIILLITHPGWTSTGTY
jgi:hypothetical protein